MRFDDFRRLPTFVLAAVILAGARPASVATADQGASERRQILDLKYTILDIAGKTQTLRIRETDTEIRLELAADVLFDFDKADIKPEAQAALKQAAGVIRDKAKGQVRVEGHTDSKGSDAYNQRLSERRADAVKEWLTAREGLNTVRFATAGFGAKRPVAPNAKPDGSDDPDGRQKNRRVEIVIAKR